MPESAEQLVDEFGIPVIPERATIRAEYTRCGRWDCTKRHGPYYYAYWKQDGKLIHKYIGESMEAYEHRAFAKLMNYKPSDFRKGELLIRLAKKGHPRAREYLKKVDSRRCSIDWAFKRVNDTLIGSAVVKLMREGREVTPSNLESYINSEFM